MTRPALLTLAALLLCWPIWLAAGWLVEALLPGGPVLLLRGAALFLALGALDRGFTWALGKGDGHG